jgi:GTP cyclohydrolase I
MHHDDDFREPPARRPDGEAPLPEERGRVLLGPDLGVAREAARTLLTAIGIDLHAPGMEATPERMVRALVEMTTPEHFSPTVFEPVGDDGMVIVRDVPFVSVCEHHILPFTGTAHIGYLPRKKILGLSKFARLVHAFARRPQVQERMTAQIADWLVQHLEPAGVGVLVGAEHACMTLRGVGAHGSRTTTSALRGVLLTEAAARAEFMRLAGRP